MRKKDLIEKKQLGIYWGSKSIYFVESLGNTISKHFEIPLSTKFDNKISGTPPAAEIAPVIQNTLKNFQITTKEVNFSIPSKDIIFRSFILPWMQSNEIKTTVKFEAGKYLPFSLDELTYTYHSMSNMEGGIRQIRIIFAAIKNESFHNYTSILEKAGLTVNFIEPAPSSLIRALQQKDFIPSTETIALVERYAETGKIIIVNQGIPQFVREFQLRSLGQTEGSQIQDAYITHLTNEARISLDYFNRQDNQINVKQILLLSSIESDKTLTSLSEALDLPAKNIEISNIFNNNSLTTLEYLYAYGATLIPTVTSPVHFNFTTQETKSQFSTFSLESLRNIKLNIKSLAITAAVCAALIGSTQFLTAGSSQNLKKKELALKQNLGTFESSNSKKITEQLNSLKFSLEQTESLKDGSHVAYFLKAVPELLPEGAWLKSFDISYSDLSGITSPNDSAKSSGKKSKDSDVKISKPTLNISGYVYLENQNEQFRLANVVLRNLKDDPEFKKSFEKIEFETVKAEQIGNFKVTYFKISCY